MGARARRGEHEDTVFVNGRILTMDGDSASYAEAVAIRGGRIAFVGGRTAAHAAFPDAVVRDLEGQALLPGFIDAHSHFLWGVDTVNQANVSGPPVGPCTDIATVIAELARFRDERGIDAGGWLVGYGYDPEGLAEKRHITKADLDPTFPDHLVLLIHVSGHGAVMNSRTLAWAGIDASTETPAGGVIARMEGSTEPAGLLMETAYLPTMERLPRADEQQRLELLDKVQQMWTSQGYTHAQEGFSTLADLHFLEKAKEQGRFYIDVASLGSFSEAAGWVGNPDFPVEDYVNGFRIAGMKVAQDGSPQGRTAYVTEPFLTGGPSGQPDWRGEPTMPYETFATVVKGAFDAGLRVFVHANGDAAIDDVISAVRDAGVTADDDKRTVVIHSQFQRPDHLPDYLQLGVTPSYFTNHTFFWGDVHTENIGPDKAAFISPMVSAIGQGLVVSNHSDFTVTPLDPFLIMWTSMARTTRSGVVLGPGERVTAYQAVQALTSGPAYQMCEENRKGRIAEGMLADFVILSGDPIQAGVEAIRDLHVVETIKEGITVYRDDRF